MHTPYRRSAHRSSGANRSSRASTLKSSTSRRNRPLAPRPTPGPVLPANTPTPLRGKAKAHEAAQGAPHAPSHSSRGLKTARTALRSPCSVRHSVRPGARCSLQPVPLFPPPSASRAQDPRSRVRSAPSHRFTASRQSLSSLSCSHPRATPLFRLPAASSDPPPPASSHERSFRLSARAPPTDLREKASRQRTSEYSLRVRLRRTRSKKRGSVHPLPLPVCRLVYQAATRQSCVVFGSIRPNTASANCFTAKTAMKKALTGMAR